jgi:hypothetical protein
MRVKKITIEDDGDYMIGALSMDQVESVVGSMTGNKTGHVQIVEVVAMSLNNAIKKANPELDDNSLPWSVDRVRKTFDLVTMPIIKNEVLKFSNLRQEEKETGEATAAQSKPE